MYKLFSYNFTKIKKGGYCVKTSKVQKWGLF